MFFLQLLSLFLLATGCLARVARSSKPQIKTVGTLGCGKDLPAEQLPVGGASHNLLFTQTDGNPRSYLIHIPSSYSKDVPVPLIFSFHGHGKNAMIQDELSQFSNETLNPSAIAVYPQGIDGQWQGDPTSPPAINDVAFVQDLIDHLSSQYCLDRTRIYAAGKSNGGGFTNVLACDPLLSTLIAAFAPVSGAFYESNTSASDCVPQNLDISCNPGRVPVPILEFHGSADATINYEGGARKGACLPSIPHWIQDWSIRNGFDSTNVTTDLYDNRLHKYEYGHGENLGIVTHYLTDGLGHDWPSIEANNDNPDGTFYDATPIIMEFFGR
ncbi:ferulic acid esterase [Phlyctema vagabunda]|uniref:feruloyl esterase n=1 Tax=Phlyctema vagabunda TaxID=108571 RepID=A0ABR4PAD3_9HELO